MAARTKAPRKPWLCTKCGAKNEWRGSSRKCQWCDSPVGRRKKRVAPHARTLRDESPETYARLSRTIHGGDLGDCGCCGKPIPDGYRHERDHDHRTGKARGVCCFRCNRELLRHHTLESARMIVSYFERVEAFYAR